MQIENSYKLLSNLHKVCLKQQIPFVSYRLPLETNINSLVQYQTKPEKLKSLQDMQSKKGFIIAPFLTSDDNSSYLLKPDYIFENNAIDEKAIQTLSAISSFLTTEKEASSTLKSTEEKQFIEQVEIAKNTISNGNCSKIVLSKVHLEDKKTGFDASNLFLQLCEIYPHAFVSIIQIPEVGCWIGASPEPLTEIILDSVQSVSLAGTQKAPKKFDKDIAWSKKEVNEQAIVTNYIEDILYSFQIRKILMQGPFSYKAGNLIHLKTVFSFDKATLDNRLGEFIAAIHPTPSICGLPKKEALDFILANEQHNRSYYAGYLGPLNIADETHLFVNLRCLQVCDKHLVLYSGAGITAGSNANKEWEETEHKMMTLLHVIEKI